MKALHRQGILLFFALTLSFSFARGGQKPSLSELIEKLKGNPDGPALHFLLDDLRSYGPEAQEAFPLVAALMKHQESWIRKEAAVALVDIASDPGQLVEALQGVFQDPDVWVRHDTAEALAKLNSKQVVPLLQEAVKDFDPGVSEAAIKALEALGPAAEAAVPTLIQALDGPSFMEAVRALGEIGAASASAVPILVQWLGQPDPSMQRSAARTLGKIGPAAKAALPELHKLAASNEGVLALLAQVAAAKIEEKEESAVPGVLKALQAPSPNPGMREYALEMLADLGPAAGAAVPALIEELNNPSTRVKTAWVLGCIGPAAKAAEPALNQALLDSDLYFKQEAAAALEKIRRPAP